VNFQIYTMFVNRKDLLVRALECLGRYAALAVVLDNSPGQDLALEGFAGEIRRPSVPLFCAQSYNLILSLARQRGQDAFFIMHSDAEASEAVVEAALGIAERLNADGVRWGVMFTNYDVLCLHNTAALAGFRWDQYLPLYYTDVDFYYRLRLAGLALVETGLPVVHAGGGSSSVKADPALDHFVRSNYSGWRDYYMAKWGGERDQERFTTPFGK
jgi:hypothetical protein